MSLQTNKDGTFDNQRDSISILINFTKNEELSLEKRIFYLDKAFKKTLQINNDSLKNKLVSKIALRYSKLKDSASFRKANRISLQLSKELKDSLRLAYNYWDLGAFYTSHKVNDSAYYNYFKAQKIFKDLGNNFYYGRMLMNIAIIQSELRDYTGSEVTTFKAIEILEPLGKNKELYKCYNNLGVIFNELHEYEKALRYHIKALEYQSQMKEDEIDTRRENSLNNIGVVYGNQNQFDKAKENYIKALQTVDLEFRDSKLYAMLLDNLAYSKFKLNDTLGVRNLFKKSMLIRDSINDDWGKSMVKLHLAEFHATYNDSLNALKLAKEAKNISERTKNYRDLLTTLMMLTKLDKNNSDKYAQQYISLNERLREEERAIIDKFARIRYETNEFIIKNEELAEQRNRILIIGSIIIVLGILIYIIRDQHVKNIRLRLEKEQQLANEEIYNLMLTQQNKLDEGKRNEKKRMSEELHDGVLGNLYGIKMNLAVLNAQNNTDAVLKREGFIEGLSNVIDEIRNVSHELHANAIDVNVGYIQLIDELLLEKSKLHGYNYKLLTDDSTIWTEIKGDIKMNIYRIIQEAIQNINKYAEANNVTVILKTTNDVINLAIIDDGLGFNTSTNKPGIGLKNMKSRLERLNGTVQLNSELKKGTSININIPYNSI